MAESEKQICEHEGTRCVFSNKWFSIINTLVEILVLDGHCYACSLTIVILVLLVLL
jgi:hypothetical protein